MKSLVQTFRKTAISHRGIYFAAFIVLGLAANAAAQIKPKIVPPAPPSMPAPPPPQPAIMPTDRGVSPAAASAAAAPPTASTAAKPAQPRRRTAHLKVCGNPQVACRTSLTFKEYDLPFQMPANTAIYETELFYAVILKSVRSTMGDDCQVFVPESDRLAAQALFPDRKVFTSRCYEPGEVGYTNTSSTAHFMAVYGGLTLAEANRILAKVRATGKYSGANIRRMRAMLNGT